MNYRPPSSLGNDVPTTDNIYNGDPSQPLNDAKFNISRLTGTFKQCLGKSSRQDCGCTTEMALSQKVSNSDCIDTVTKLYMLMLILYV